MKSFPAENNAFLGENFSIKKQFFSWWKLVHPKTMLFLVKTFPSKKQFFSWWKLFHPKTMLFLVTRLLIWPQRAGCQHQPSVEKAFKAFDLFIPHRISPLLSLMIRVQKELFNTHNFSKHLTYSSPAEFTLSCFFNCMTAN